MNTIRKILFRKTTVLFIVSIVLCSSFVSCESFLEEKDIPRLTPAYYGTLAGVDAAATAAYSYMRWGAGNLERFNSLTEYGTDLFTQGEDPGTWGAAFNQYGSQLNADASVLYALWENHYKAISTTNLVIQQVEESTTMTDAQKQSSIAEMSFLRAYFYFDLVQQFGNIPLVLDVFFEVRTDFPRSPIAKIYEQIIEDLEYAVPILPERPAATGRTCRYSAAHLLAKVYLTRGSAIQDPRGQQSTDMDNALKYAKMVIESNQYELLSDFAALWDIDNQRNREVIFALQFTYDAVYNGDGNSFHLYWGSWYEDLPGMFRDIANGRPFRRHRQTERVMTEIFDRKNDSRFYKSFKWAYYANQVAPGLSIGDTAIYYSINPAPEGSSYSYRYIAWNKTNLLDNNRYYPNLLKFLDPKRLAVGDERGGREWVRMRLGETYLIAAEAAGRKGDYTTAVNYINVLRQRAAWKQGEIKMPQYWREEGGQVGDTNSTYPEIELNEADINTNFIDFILEERGRELLGEMNRWEDLVRCEKLFEYVQKYNPDAFGLRAHHKLRPIPQRHIDRLNPRGSMAEEQNEGYY